MKRKISLHPLFGYISTFMFFFPPSSLCLQMSIHRLSIGLCKYVDILIICLISIQMIPTLEELQTIRYFMAITKPPSLCFSSG